jgi:hypothetical protein
MKTAKIFKWIFTFLLVIGFLGAGITKLIGIEIQVQNFKSWGYPDWLRYPVGLSEIILAVALVLVKPRSYVVYAIFIGAIIAITTHLQAGQANQIGGTVVFVIFNTLLLLSIQKSHISRADWRVL